jgi:DNA-binding transcriptional regulator YiaG
MSKTRTFKNFMGLEYLNVTLPVRQSKSGEVVDLDPALIEREVARFLLEKPIAIRGKEAKLLRKILGLSMERFGRELDTSASAICKWEADPVKRIGISNEVMLRVFVAESLGISIPGKLSALTGQDTPGQISLPIRKTALAR